MIEEYFINYAMLNSDVTVDGNGKLMVHNKYAEDWDVTLADTGEDTQIGGRLKRVRRYLDQDRLFFMTYGDGLSDIDIRKLFAFDSGHGRKATVSGVRPTARFGALDLDGHQVRFWQPMDTLRAKHHLKELWQNGDAPWKLWDEARRAKRHAA